MIYDFERNAIMAAFTSASHKEKTFTTAVD